METPKEAVSTKSANRVQTIGCKGAAGCALALFIACGSPVAASVPDRSTTPAARSATPISDGDITDAVKTEFGVRPLLSAESFKVSTSEGIVLLSGTAGNILAKDRAEEVVLAIKGVRGVVNRIEVKAPGRSDAEIRKDVEKAILTDPATDSYEIQVSVTGGKVALTGKVDSWAESQLATTVAKKVKGVRQVDNHIALEYKTDRIDGEIATEIQQKLRYDALVNDALIESRVKDGAVTLLGTVGSALEKTRAHNDAWVAGVRSVNADALKVDPDVGSGALRKDKFVDKTGAQVQQAVRDALMYDPRVNFSNVVTWVSNGAVTLTGTVDNLQAKRAAEADARNVVGVRQVTNNLKIKSRIISATVLAANVDWALVADPVVDQYQINATVRDGRVTLQGTVSTYYERMHAENVVAGLTGVTGVVNNLKVDDTQSYLFWTDVDPAVTLVPKESDEEIKKDIQNQIWWSPFVDHEAVTVNVNNGKATLNGTVDSWIEENAAIENAFEGGAIAVVSNLEIADDQPGKD